MSELENEEESLNFFIISGPSVKPIFDFVHLLFFHLLFSFDQVTCTSYLSFDFASFFVISV